MAAERKPPGASGAHIPDLDVRPSAPRTSGRPEKATARPQASAPVPSKRAAESSVQDYFGSGTFDADHFGDLGAGPTLLTDDSSIGAFGEPSFSKDESDDPSTSFIDVAHPALKGVSPRIATVATSATWPTGRSPESASLTIDPVEVRIAADYGAPPATLFATPVYAVRVLQRRGSLRTRLERASDAFSQAERARDELLVSAIQDLRGKVLLVEGGEELFAPVLEIERLALERRSALAGTNEEHDRRAAEIERGANALRQEAVENRAHVEQAAAELTRKKERYDRAAAKKKRLYIEIRGILDASEKSGGALSPARSSRIAELESDVAAHNPELERSAHDVNVATSAHDAAEAEGKRIARRLAEADRVRKALDEEFQKQIGVRTEGVSESERQRAEALAEVMRRLLASHGRFVEIPRDVLDAIQRGDDTVAQKALELEKLVRAIDSYDQNAYQRGLVVMGTALALLIGVIVVALFR